uniref:Ig-like domain-containing protein n=1 Tax=Chelydra serpentina TaxID=8475 RepID=A0A8C3SWA2_CHESE
SAVPFLSLALSLAGCWAVMGPGTAHGRLGGSVSVRCRYGAGYAAYPKFWCRRKVVLCFNHLIFETTGSEAEERWGRVSIRDNHTQRVFTVTVGNLTLADAGIYLCGVARIGLPNPRDSVEVIVSPGKAFLCSPMAVTGEGELEEGWTGRGRVVCSSEDIPLTQRSETLLLLPSQGSSCSWGQW